MSLLRQVWKWGWVVTLPIACLYLLWSWETLSRYWTFGVRYDPSPFRSRLHDIGSRRFAALKRKASVALREPWQVGKSQPDDLPVINLRVPLTGISRLNADLPHSGFEYVRGRIWNVDRFQNMKMRYRGDFSFHWRDDKKSLRVKVSKRRLYEGLRAFNLIAVKQLWTHFGYVLAKDLELLAPTSKFVEVALNGRMLGVHVYAEQLEELTIRTNGFMPGDLYAGELLSKDAWQGVTSQVFDHPELWKKVAVNNHYELDSKKPLHRLLNLIRLEDRESAHREIASLLDLPAWGRMAAFETLCQSFHFDDTHNWRLYYDPMRSRFFPVIWDPASWHKGWVPKQGEDAQLDVIPSALHRFLFSDAAFLRARAKALHDFYARAGDTSFLAGIDKLLPALERAVARDPLVTGSSEEALVSGRDFRETVRRVFASVKQQFMAAREPVRYSTREEGKAQVTALSIPGRMPVRDLQLTFGRSIDQPVTGEIRFVMNGKTKIRDISARVSAGGPVVDVALSLVSRCVQENVGGHILMRRRLRVEAGHYDLILRGVSPDNPLIDLQYTYGDGKARSAERVASIQPQEFVDLYNIVEEQPIRLPKVWDGVVDISEDTFIDGTLILRPGTVVRFAPGKSLVLRGRLLAEGTKSKPIQFQEQETGQEPWGALVLTGSQTSGSRLLHCVFKNGSGMKRDLFEYTAMLSIHEGRRIEVSHCLFQDSRLTDDMVHAVYAEVRFSDCRFERSLMDALDVDICDAIIEGCTFTGSGNDAIDLMTSNAVVLDCVIEDGGDKAISVGEGARLLAINSIFRRNVIGVQAKDGAVALLYNTDFLNNDLALDAYKKNWRYNDGGRIYTNKSRFRSNKRSITVDKRSVITVSDSYLDGPVEKPGKRIRIAASVDNLDPNMAKNKAFERKRIEDLTLGRFDSAHLDRIDTKRRGATNLANH